MTGKGRPARGLVVAGTKSGCGKTSVALGLMAALARRGHVVQPFKAGPDFIDPGLHELAAGRQSSNLDGWILDRDTVRSVFAAKAKSADICVVEGVMGLYDGASGTDEAGSTAELAKWLGLPVLLVADARSMARSAAALVQGYAGFDPGLDFVGVVLNRVGGAGHRELLTEALWDGPVPLLGLLPRDEELSLPSRHLGLVTADEGSLTRDMVRGLADWVEQNMDLDRLVRDLPEIRTESYAQAPVSPAGPVDQAPPLRIAVARDKAFCFYYPENLALLEAFGADLVYFSPLAGEGLPRDIQGLYLGGGYPELAAEPLSRNERLRQEVREFSLARGPVYAECGGFMYLLQSLRTLEGKDYPMAGVFPMRCAMLERFSALGYREALLTEDAPLGKVGTRLKGHEFHYSKLLEQPGKDDGVRRAYDLFGRKGALNQAEGYVRGNTLGSYVHAHFLSNPETARAFVRTCREWAKSS